MSGEVVLTGYTKADGKTLWWEYDGFPLVHAGKGNATGKNKAVHLVLATDYAALQAKLDAVTKDAERYRWLRESGLEIAWNAQVSYSPGYEAGDAEQMDLAIDAAIDRTRSRHITEHQE